MPNHLDGRARSEGDQEQSANKRDLAEEEEISSRNLPRCLEDKLSAIRKKICQPACEESDDDQNQPAE